ncbi:MAG: Glu-tRNA(Gln) amidotransferase subunit GatE [Thermoplasmata archaeon]|nr:MAG: Glu-tRNA(Gln) amidotransferase subunit GatE [Thermoplasmata archaeon]
MDYKKLGFKAGLEIHQQLATHKLFCSCPSALTEEEDAIFSRRLRPTQSELGEVDRAALEEARRGKKFIYHSSRHASCLVEADEEPPHEANGEAIDIALTVALLLNADIVDEIHFMRKIVIDGSNTTGFQRTALIAMNGKIDGVGIETICLEEDAARKLRGNKKEVEYALDRLGIPLVEIATSPSISSPQHAREVAEKIGLLLRATKKVKRGIGTIRQDLNVSIKRGNRVEIKGVQELNDIPKILENEVKRQIELIEVSKALKERIKEKDLEKVVVKDVSSIFKKTSSKFIRKAIEKGVTLALKLPSFDGLIGGVKYKEHRLGKEFAMHAKLEGGGIIHSDELPNYGISEKEVEEIRRKLNCEENDAFVISAGKKSVAEKCLKAVLLRARQAWHGVPEEVRRALPDGFTEYMRPMPTAARMYPETDIPPVRVTRAKIEKLKKKLPELPDEKIERMMEQYGLSNEEARQIVFSDRDDIFEELAKKHGHEKLIARILLNMLPEMEREGYKVANIDKRILSVVLEGLKEKKYAKEAIEKLLRHFSQYPHDSLQEAMKACKLGFLSEEKLRKIIRKIVNEKIEFIKERRERAISPLMGIAMKKLRGKADGALVNKILKEEIEKIISSG